MAGYVVLGFLAAFGTLCLLWTLLGWLLSSCKGMVLVCMDFPTPGNVERYRWLRGMGFLNCPLVIVMETDPEQMPQDMEICSRKTLINRLEREKDFTYGTGTGNSAGCNQRRGISEL